MVRSWPACKSQSTTRPGIVYETLSSDQFGFYRADDLAPGEYRVEARKDGRVLSERRVIVTDSFLFDQDLIVR